MVLAEEVNWAEDKVLWWHEEELFKTRDKEPVDEAIPCDRDDAMQGVDDEDMRLLCEGSKAVCSEGAEFRWWEECSLAR